MKLVQTTEATHNGKTGGFTASEMQRREQERLDQVVITVRCAHCPDWTFTGPSVEARAAASLHREEQHPGFNRTDGKTAKTRQIEAARVRRTEREEAERDTRLELARQRDALEALDDGLPQPVLGEAEPNADVPPVEDGLASRTAGSSDAASTTGGGSSPSASPNTDERTGMECKIDGCHGDASDAPDRGRVTEQLAIDAVERSLKDLSQPKPLTDRQQLAFDYVRERDGVTCDEVGAFLHAHKERRPHSVDERCDWCARDGRSVLTSKALAPLVTYRRAKGGNLYVARNRADRVRAPVPIREPTEAELQANPFVGLDQPRQAAAGASE